jgi:predicted Zn-dependent peptidase
MPNPPIRVLELSCGATLLVEPATSGRSAALSWMVPVGTATDPPGCEGDSVLLAELIQRGAGGRSSREYSDALDRLGVRRSVAPGPMHLSVSVVALGRNLPVALPLVVDLIRRPGLPAEALDPARNLALQAIEGLEDDPQEKVGILLRDRLLPPPFNRSGYGQVEDLEGTSIERLRQVWSERAVPKGSIIAAAGDVDADALARSLDGLLADWSGSAPEPVETAAAAMGTVHEESDSSQSHLAIGFTAPPENDPDSLAWRLAVRILGGGSSSRLFTEVREKRGLCYAVGASYSSGRDRGALSIYAGSTPERAQETVDCILKEVAGFERGVTAEEFQRATIGQKSGLVMSGESTSARATSLAADWYRLGRPRSLDELAAEVDAVTLTGLNEAIARRMGAPWRARLAAATIGPKALRIG